jgi:hypothetical protein
MHKLIVSTLVLALSACATARSPALDASVPDALKPDASESLAMVVAAQGVQIYECRAAKQQPGAYEWAFVAPEAELFDTSGRDIGKHYAGPRWEAADGSKIVGRLKAQSDAPRPQAIPWLLLSAKSDGVPGSFSNITSVQRVNTVGGVAPRTGCSQSAAGTVVRVPYAADYYFFARVNDARYQIKADANTTPRRRYY